MAEYTREMHLTNTVCSKKYSFIEAVTNLNGVSDCDSALPFCGHSVLGGWPGKKDFKFICIYHAGFLLGKNHQQRSVLNNWNRSVNNGLRCRSPSSWRSTKNGRTCCRKWQCRQHPKNLFRQRSLPPLQQAEL